VRTASVVVAGCGVMGASVAWHLARRGLRDVLVVDRGARAGLGSTGAATGGFRAQFASPVNVRLSLLAREKLRGFREELGVDSGYRPRGYLWLASDARQLAVLRAALAVQQREGLSEANEVGPDEIARLQPAIADAGIVGGTFCPTDGYIVPLAILQGYAADAERRGVRFAWGAELTGIERGPDGGMVAVRVGAERISCDRVVNACGAWAASVAALAGLELPVTPLRRQVAMTVPCTRVPPNAPMTIWTEDGFHIRPRDGRVLFAFPSPGDPRDPFATGVEPRWLEEVDRKKEDRVAALRGIPIDRAACWAGLYEMSPDKHAILGEAPGCARLFLINGSSGHGVMHAPALGQLLAEILIDGKATSFDATPLRPERFAESAPNPGEIL
jgi:sarcosine oxidase subunit beta